MKRFLVAAAIAALGATAASAADMAARTYTKAPVMAAPVYNWTGIYIGAHVGAAFETSRLDSTLAPPFERSDKTAVLGGGQFGADYQFAPNWLIGIEAQGSGVDLNRNFVQLPLGGRSVTAKTDWLASVTGRLGFTWGPGLIYAKGGVAFQNNDAATFFASPGNPVTTLISARNDTGYTVGGGFEYMFASAWSAKIEYQYFDFGTSSLTAAGAPPLVSYRDDLHTVKAGINYHFNWGGPVVAKY